MSRKGFTLLEILLVIAAIGILASIVIVAINPGRQLAQARNAERQQEVQSIYDAVIQFAIETGGNPPSDIPVGDTQDDYQEICRQDVLEADCTTDGLLYLQDDLVPTYLAAIPEDPTRAEASTANGTGYEIKLSTGDVISLGVRSSENDEIIAVNDSSYTPPGIVGPFSPNEFGTTFGAGPNSSGGLGIGSTASPITTFTANVDTSRVWKDVEVWGGTTIAIAEDGTLWGWGANSQNMLMNQSSTDTPVQLDSGYWIDVDIGEAFVMGIRSTGASQEMGEMYTWGDRRISNGHACGWCSNFTSPYRLGNGYSEWDSADWISVEASRDFSVGIRSADGTTTTQGEAWRWGAYNSSTRTMPSNSASHLPQQIGSETDWVRTEVSNNNGYLLNTAGELHSWGEGNWGYLGRASGDTSTPGIVSGGHTWTDIAVPPNAEGTMYAIHTDGSLYAWGREGYYSFGNGFYSNNPPGNWPNTVSTPTQISSDTDWKDVSGGDYGALALKGDNYDVYGWGVNSNGWLGTGDTNDVPNIPTEPIIAGPYSRVLVGRGNISILIE